MGQRRVRILCDEMSTWDIPPDEFRGLKRLGDRDDKFGAGFGTAAQEFSDKGVRACFRRSARLTSTWALTLTAVVEVDVAVDVEPIVDLDVDRRVRPSS